MRSITVFIIAVFAACFSTVTFSHLPPTSIIYINGIQNTWADADATRKKIRDILRDSTNRATANKRSFDVAFVWNPEGFYETPVNITNCGPPCQDIYELLVLKSSEEDYDPYFRKILAPHNASAVIDVGAAREVKKYADSLVLGTNSALSSGFITADRMAATKKALDSVSDIMRQVNPTIIVAHSQGNILANLAWASVAAELGQDIRKRARVVNIANTSRFSLNNLILTHDNDNVLAALKVAPGVYNFSRSTPNCSGVCDFEITPPTFKAPSLFSCFLLTCKHWMSTYLSNDDIPNRLVDQGVFFTPGKTHFADRFEDLVYAAVASLDAERLVVVADADFAAWSSFSFVANPSAVSPGPGTSLGTATRVASGGHPGAYLATALTVTFGDTLWAGAIKTDYMYAPSVDGAVATVSVSADVTMFDAGAASWQLVIEQGGRRFYSFPFGAFSGGWATVTVSSLTPANFDTNPWAGHTGEPTDGKRPDFGSTALPLKFGFMVGNQLGGAGTATSHHGIDNFAVTIAK